MKKIIILLFLAAFSLLSGCASLSPDPHPGKLERVGVLLVKNCEQLSNCSQYSLLEPDMQKPTVALSGQVDRTLRGRLIAVLGTDAGEENGLQLVQVERTRAISEFDYQAFMPQAVADYIQQEYSCISLWDQSYAWRLDGRQPVLIASLINPLYPERGLDLEYDGLNGALLRAESDPEDADPCRLR